MTARRTGPILALLVAAALLLPACGDGGGDAATDGAGANGGDAGNGAAGTTPDGGSDGSPAAEPERITLEADGVQVVADLRPAPDAPAVVLVHMVGGRRGDWDPLVPGLAGAGYAVLALDLPGHGDSTQTVGGDPVPMPETTDEWLRGVDAVRAAVDHLAADMPDRRIALVGASIGANLALREAAADDRVTAVVLLSAGMDYKGVTLAEPLGTYAGRPAMVLATAGDEPAAAAAWDMYDVLQGPGVRMSVHEDSQAHGTRMFGSVPGVDREILSFLQEHLKQ